MKKKIFIVLMLTFCLILTGCGNEVETKIDFQNDKITSFDYSYSDKENGSVHHMIQYVPNHITYNYNNGATHLNKELTQEQYDKFITIIRELNLQEWQNVESYVQNTEKENYDFSIHVVYENNKVLSAHGNITLPSNYDSVHEKLVMQLNLLGGLK